MTKSSVQTQSKLYLFYFQLLLNVVFFYISFVSIYIFFSDGKEFDLFTFFFSASTVVFTSLLTYSNLQSIKKLNDDTISSRLFFICFLSFLIGVFNIYDQYSSRGLNWSEIHQFQQSGTFKSPIDASVSQQQPPLDFYFSAFSYQLWGYSTFSVRFHAILFYLFLCLFLPLILWCFCHSYWITSIGSLIFSINHSIRLHSLDARPLSLAIFSGFLFLFFYLSHHKIHSRKQKIISITASQYLFLMSIGFQPIVFIISLFLSSFYDFFNKAKKDDFKILLTSHILTMILTAPFYIKMYFFADSSKKYTLNIFSNIVLYVKNFSISTFIERFFYTFYEQFTLSFSLFLLILIILCFYKKPSRHLTKIAMATIIFPFLFDFIFQISIKWYYNNWYFIIFSLFLILFVVLGLNEISLFKKKQRWKKFILLPLASLFLWNAYDQIIEIKEKTQFRYPYLSKDINQVYDYLKENGEPTDLAVQLAFTQIPLYRANDLILYKNFLYLKNHHPFIVDYYIKVADSPPYFYEKDIEMIYYVDWKKIPKNKKQKIFFITNRPPEGADVEDRARMVLSGFMKEVRIGRFSIFQLHLNNSNREKQYQNFIEKLIKKAAPQYSTSLYETLLFYACKNKNDEKFNQLLNKYRNLEPVLDEFVSVLNYPSRFVLKRRADLFEKKPGRPPFCE